MDPIAIITMIMEIVKMVLEIKPDQASRLAFASELAANGPFDNERHNYWLAKATSCAATNTDKQNQKLLGTLERLQGIAHGAADRNVARIEKLLGAAPVVEA